MKRAVAVCLALLLAACATGGRKAPPDWLSGAPAAYPEARYLVARGQGPTLELAQDRARAELAKTFQVRIRAASEDLTRYLREAGGDGVRERLEQSVSRQVSSETGRVLEGVEIADLWRDPERGGFYALAVLDRQRAAALLRSRLADLDRASEGALARDGDELARLRGLYAAYRAQLARAPLAAAYAVVSPAPPPSPPVALGELQRRLGAALNRLAVAPEGRPEALHAALADALAALGVQVAKDAAPYRLQGALEITPVGWRAGWYWLRATLTLTLGDAQGHVRAARRLPLKAAALDEAQAQARLASEAAKAARQAVAELILGSGTLPGAEAPSGR